jgi:tetratricopeptide (TPR) repeat protein/predicted Ser/Thr protein kinase
MIGTTLSHYRILSKLGEGGMGEVYLAQDLKLDREVAIKVLPAGLVTDEERRQRFVREARAAAAIEHPHIAVVHEIDDHDGRMFLAMEYVRGSSLRQLIESRRLTVPRALDLASQVAEGLAKAHERGIVHRDLKPGNVLVSEDGFAKIIDFGLAKLVEPLRRRAQDSERETILGGAMGVTREGVILGTVAYMSPEQARGEPVDARSDIFSFGVMLHEMLTGSPPFTRDSAVETLSAIVRDDPPPLTASSRDLPADMPRVVRKLLAKDPGSRYQGMKDVAIDLREIRATLDARRRLEAPPDSAKPAPKRTVWIAAMGAVAVVASVGLWLASTRRPETATAIGSSGRPAIAVLAFDNPGRVEEVAWLSKGLPSMLMTGLAQTPGLDIISESRLEQAMKEAGQRPDAVDRSEIPGIARTAGAGAVVVGNVFKAGDDVRIDVRLEEVSSGRLLFAETVRGADVFPLVDDLTRRIRDRLSLSAADTRRVAEVTSSSIDAYRAYTEGREAQHNLRFADARRLFQRAIEIDPTFAMAYYSLALVSDQLGETSEGSKYREALQPHLDRLPERQRTLVMGQGARREGDYQRAAALLEALVAKYPDEEEGYHQLAHAYRDLSQFDKELATQERGLKVAPQSDVLRNEHGYSLLLAGRYAEAVSEFESYVRLRPGEPNPYDSLAEAQLMAGEPERAAATYAQALTINPLFGSSLAGRVWAFGVLGRYDEALAEARKLDELVGRINVPRSTSRALLAFVLSRTGRYREAAPLMEEAVQAAASVKDGVRQAAALNLACWMAIERADYKGARTLVARALTLGPSLTDAPPRVKIATQILAGIAEARAGDVGAASQRLESQAGLVEPRNAPEKWWIQALEGEIALARGDPAAAEAAFAAGMPEARMWFSNGNPDRTLLAQLPFRDGPARARAARGDLPGAIALYRELLTSGASQKWTAMFEPRFVLALARLLERTGDTAGARQQYSRFLELWEDADEDLPELGEARAKR